MAESTTVSGPRDGPLESSDVSRETAGSTTSSSTAALSARTSSTSSTALIGMSPGHVDNPVDTSRPVRSVAAWIEVAADCTWPSTSFTFSSAVSRETPGQPRPGGRPEADFVRAGNPSPRATRSRRLRSEVGRASWGLTADQPNRSRSRAGSGARLSLWITVCAIRGRTLGRRGRSSSSEPGQE